MEGSVDEREAINKERERENESVQNNLNEREKKMAKHEINKQP